MIFERPIKPATNDTLIKLTANRQLQRRHTLPERVDDRRTLRQMPETVARQGEEDVRVLFQL